MDLAELYEASRTRAAKQHVIEEAIDKFSPDYTEAAEIIAAVVGQLRHRYDNLLSVDLEHCFQELLDQLDEEQMCERPEGIDEATASKWEQERQMEEEEELLNGHRTNDEA